MADSRRKALLRSSVQKFAQSIDQLRYFVEDDDFPFDEEFVDDLIAMEKVALDYLGQEVLEED